MNFKSLFYADPRAGGKVPDCRFCDFHRASGLYKTRIVWIDGAGIKICVPNEEYMQSVTEMSDCEL